MAEPVSAKPRSATGHVLLPAFDNHQNRILVPVATTQNLLSWTFGRGTVVRAALRDGAWDKFAGVSGTCADNVMCNLDLAHMACRSLAHRLCCRYAPDLFLAIVLLIFPSRRGSQLVVVTLSMETRIHLGIPNVMLTLLGMYTVFE